jgi:hypothetical protein
MKRILPVSKIGNPLSFTSSTRQRFVIYGGIYKEINTWGLKTIIVIKPTGHGQDNRLVAVSQEKQVVVPLNGPRDVGDLERGRLALIAFNCFPSSWPIVCCIDQMNTVRHIRVIHVNGACHKTVEVLFTEQDDGT